MRLVVPELVTCIGPLMPLSPCMKSCHALSHLRMNNRVDRHAVELKAANVNVPVNSTFVYSQLLLH